MNKSHLYRHIFLRNMFVVIMLTLIAIIAMFFYGTNLTKKDMYNIQKAYLEQQRDKIDTNVSMALKMIGQFEDDSYFAEYFRDTTSDPFVVAKVSERIGKMVNPFSSLGYTIALRKNSNNQIIGQHNTALFDDYFLDMGFPKATVDSIRKYLAENKFNGQSYYTIGKGESSSSKENVAFTILYQKKYTNGVSVDFFISFYQDIIIPELDASQDRGFMVFDNDNEIAASETARKNNVPKILKESGISAKDIDELYSKTEYKGYVFHKVRSGVIPNWNYIYIIKNDNYFLFNIILISVSVAFIFMLLGTLVAGLNAKWIYSPIRSIVDVFKQNNDKEENELEFIKTAAITISNTNDELYYKIKNQSEDLKVKRFSDLLYGLIKKEDVEQIIHEYELQKYLFPVNVVIIELINLIKLEETFSKERIVEVKQNILNDICLQLRDVCECIALEIDYKRYVLIVNKENSEIMKGKLHAIISNIEDVYGIQLIACIGKDVESLYNADNSFSDAVFVLEHKYAIGKKTVISAKELGKLKDNSYYYPIDVERNLLLYIENGEKDKISAILKRLLAINLYEHELTKEGIVEFIYAVVATVKRLLQQMNMTVEEIFGEGSILYLELKVCESPQQLEDKILEMFDVIIKKIHSEDLEIDKSLIDKITDYVRKNYNRDVSMNDVSDYFNISPGYIGQLFKTQVRTTFKDYLNMYRVQKAKELFKTVKSIKINDVARDVGCNNVSTFIRMFKRYEGISPGEYMKNMK